MSNGSATKYTLLPSCHKEARNLIIVVACDGASSTGQIGNEVARRLTLTYPDTVRMCCLSAIGAGSELHIRIFKEAKAVIAINGCDMQCASKVLKLREIKPSFVVTLTQLGFEKAPTLEFDDKDIEKASQHIVEEFIKKFSHR